MKFSITIPAYKSQYLAEAISSVVGQSHEDWELIIVDDCSPEQLDKIVEPFLDDPRIHYHRNEKNCGAVDVVDNWNICLSYCTGEYVICMGDDDRLNPNCLEEYARLINLYPELEVYHARTEIINEDSMVTGHQEERPEWESAISLLWNRWNNRENQYIGDFCYNTSKLRQHGGYYKLPLAWGSDDITAVRAARNGGIANTKKFCFQYRKNSQTITSSNNARTKLSASLSAHEWFQDFLRSVDSANLNDTDKEYIKTIQKECHTYYYKSLGKNCADDLHGNPLRLPYWYKQMAVFKFPLYLYAKWYIKSLFTKQKFTQSK